MERPEAILVIGERMLFPSTREIAWEEVKSDHISDIFEMSKTCDKFLYVISNLILKVTL